MFPACRQKASYYSIGASSHQVCSDQYDNIMLWAACYLGFFAFLRSGEFTVPSLADFNPSIYLTPQDFAVDSIENPSMVLVRIKASKCDQAKWE